MAIFQIPSSFCSSSYSGSVIRLSPEFLDPPSTVAGPNTYRSPVLSWTCQLSGGCLQSRDPSPSCFWSRSQARQPYRGCLQSLDPSPSYPRSLSRTCQPSGGGLQSRDPSSSSFLVLFPDLSLFRRLSAVMGSVTYPFMVPFPDPSPVQGPSTYTGPVTQPVPDSSLIQWPSTHTGPVT